MYIFALCVEIDTRLDLFDHLQQLFGFTLGIYALAHFLHSL